MIVTRALTEREIQVLKLIASDYSAKEAADKLGISIKTVHKHEWHIRKALGIHGRVRLIHYALHKNLVPNLYDA